MTFPVEPYGGIRQLLSLRVGPPMTGCEGGGGGDDACLEAGSCISLWIHHCLRLTIQLSLSLSLSLSLGQLKH